MTQAAQLDRRPAAETGKRRGRRSRLAVASAILGSAVVLSLAFPLWRLAGVLVTGDKAAASPVREALQLPGLTDVLRNTAVLVALGGLGAMLVGSTLAWLNERTDAHLGWFSTILPVLGLLVPPVAAAIGWVMLLSPRAGLLNAAIRGAFGSTDGEGPLNIFSWPGLVFLYVLELTPFVYVVMSAALRNIDSALEEASRMSGAGPFQTLWRVTLPAIRPALAASGLLVTTMGLAMFSVPSIIGGGARVPVLSTEILHLLRNQYPPRTSLAVVLSCIMLFVIVVAWGLQSWIARTSRTAAIGGKGVGANRVVLGRWRLPARVMIAAFILLTTALPVLALAMVSLQRFWSAHYRFDRLTSYNFQAVLVGNATTQSAILNSLVLGLLTATVAMAIAWVLAFSNSQRASVFSRAIDSVVKLPAGISHLVLGVSLLLAYGGAPFHLGGSLAILLLAYVLAYLPQGSIASGSAVSQVHPSLLEASRVSGAGEWRSLRTVAVPLMLPSIAAGWAMMFVFAFGDLTLSVLLSSPRSPTAGYMLLNLYDAGTFPLIAALGLTLTAVCALVVTAVLRLSRTRYARGRG
ncbi:iron ABC transporter permease [Dactylosporangium salmoneum]|uniref:Iron ABC transporter permease n=1 Tax=Dactylosporangium salmoneum TaxID=53361 RepID=A0ABN3FXM0_9ACTN